jgi:molecular chaperone Hsp33
VRNMLRGLGREESDSLIAERGEVEVGCEFCGLQYRFDAVDVGEMFTPGRDQPPVVSGVQ